MKRACVIGWPIRHSRSPIIHGYWLRQYGITGGYDMVEVAPENLASFIQAIGRDFAGCNVTVPHKEEVVPLLDEIDATAKAVGAVNTIWIEGGRRLGMNTDVEGFLSNLDQGAPGWDRAGFNAVVLGAGGAARAVVYGLKQRGARRITIVNRSRERADQLAREMGVEAADFGDLDALLPSAGLLVNATSLGMHGKPELDVDLTPLGRDAVVTDLVYVPLETAFLAAAKARGNRTVDGLGMLLHQAVPGFQKWFGIRPTVTEDVRALVEADILAGTK